MAIRGIGAVAPLYDGFLLDVWGVLTDGVRAPAPAISCLSALRRTGRPLALVSNTSRSAENLRSMLARMGIAQTAYDTLISSGELAGRVLREQAGKKGTYLHLGSRENTEWVTGAGLTEVTRTTSATAVLATGLAAGAHTSAETGRLLDAASRRDLPMVCANPDRVVVIGDRRLAAAGAIGAEYERRGGRVIWVGKPEPLIYEQCLESPGMSGARRILAIGDAMDTDVAGAARAGLDSVLVVGGGVDREATAAGRTPSPTYLLDHFTW